MPPAERRGGWELQFADCPSASENPKFRSEYLML